MLYAIANSPATGINDATVNKKPNQSYPSSLFFELSKKYDNIRGENLVKTFPELTELFEKYEKN
jgi:hypothetical protein